MKLAVLTFSDIKLGGLGTQAYDFARLALAAGFEAELINIEHRQSNEILSGLAENAFHPTDKGSGLKLKSTRIGSRQKVAAQSLAYLQKFDICIWVGVAPHFDAGDEQESFYVQLLENGNRHIAFATDKFIEKYYNWVIPYLNKFASRWAFAEPYQKALLKYVTCDVLPIAPLDAWNSRKYVKPSTKPRKLFWPHQWRGWKNVEMFLDMADQLDVDSIRMYASGAGIEFSVFSKSEQYKQIVRSDVRDPSFSNPNGKLELMGFVPISKIIEEYHQTAITPDFTGISSGLHEPNSYCGNYQCATWEAILCSSALLKFTTTVAPYNSIPADCVLPLEPCIKDYVPHVNAYLNNLKLADKAARNAYDWLTVVGEPFLNFTKMVDSENKTKADKQDPAQNSLF